MAQHRLRDAIDSLPDGFALFDADDRVIIHNAGFLDAYSSKIKSDVTGQTFEETVRTFVENTMPEAQDPAFDREAWIAQRMARHRNPPREPFEVKWGGDRWMRVSEQRTSHGGYVGIWTDVTEIKRIGQRLQDAINALSDGFALFDAEDRLIVCNEAFRSQSALHGGDDLVGQTMEQILRAFAASDVTDTRARTDLEGWIAQRLQHHRNPQAEPYEQVLTNGRILHISENRTSDGGIVGIWTDVTALKQAERRLEDAIKSLNEGFVLIDKDGRFAAYNERFLQLYPKTAPHVAVGAPSTRCCAKVPARASIPA
ncbi:MAG: PAS-domain containing protein [Rhodospirillaceae bacterium]|nr:PAS-domain containing protein [Rhodospirillaceae bacterium]